ncbi:hypothetical protein TTHERM_00474530 (macronuclear) [Tetrahymena thermophila SB210]|uniref:Uncharacterized protein n=1 Tax=Tetrahymena thermophila (strain SB210) TaxID=312017 RepID=I7MA45_TETTS|nr:hypothetical protein TTHERM_00474530 [Tetrahymena thermophila SB210]EAS03692.2 hypothetical protein TTHERM_00474530 [Tetrahymena thermophila SB210]|eukprot:XP_001023937.2 hypothetical protein TTHERM_00474530 [Tetrahymena thermophila SB210]
MTKDYSELSFEFPPFEFGGEKTEVFKAPMKRIHKENKQQSQLTKLISELNEITQQIRIEQQLRRKSFMQARRFVLFK